LVAQVQARLVDRILSPHAEPVADLRIESHRPVGLGDLKDRRGLAIDRDIATPELQDGDGRRIGQDPRRAEAGRRGGERGDCAATGELHWRFSRRRTRYRPFSTASQRRTRRRSNS